MTNDDALAKIQALKNLRDSGTLSASDQKTVEGACDAFSHLGTLLLRMQGEVESSFNQMRGKILDALLR